MDRFNNQEEQARWRDNARAYYYDKFYQGNDAGHGLQHVDQVYQGMLELKARRGSYYLDDDIIFMCAYTHDLFTREHRKLHHIRARDYVLANDDPYLKKFTDAERVIIGEAVSEHRSSGPVGEHGLITSHEYSLLLRVADNGKPCLKSIVTRMYATNLSISMTEQESLEYIINHLHEKFGPQGYIRNDHAWVATYQQELIEYDKLFTHNNLHHLVLEYMVNSVNENSQHDS